MYKDGVKFLDPVWPDYAVFVSVSLQSIKPCFIKMGLDVVAEICEEENLAFAIPEERVFEHFIKQHFMSVSHCFGLV